MTRHYDRAGFFYLAIIYLVWGSTYLAIRVAVREGSGFTPFMMAGTRVLVAGLILLAWAVITRQPLRASRYDLTTLAISALLLWLGGNGLVSWGEQRADSGIAALIVASVPVWSALIESIWNRRLPSLLLAGSLLTGSAGIVLLTMPVLLSGVRADLVSVFALVIGALTWALGTVIQSKRRVSLPPAVSSAYMMLLGAAAFGVTALIMREPVPSPIPEAWAAWAYLVVFGSVVAFTSYLQALRLLPTRVVTTYAYVNPIIAVFLGWLLLRENVGPWTLAGALLVLVGVSGVFRENIKKQAGSGKIVE